MNINNITKDIEKIGYAEVKDDIYISIRDLLVCDQESWENSHIYKNIDFSSYACWVHTDCFSAKKGLYTELKGFDSIIDALNYTNKIN